MTSPEFGYSNIVVKQNVEAWAEGLDFDPEEQIIMLLEDKYGPTKITVVEAHSEGDCLILTIETDCWKAPKEFALLRSGGLAW